VRFPAKFIIVAFLGILSVSCANLSEGFSTSAPGKAPEREILERNPAQRNLRDESTNESRFRTGSLALPSGRSFPIKLLFSGAEHIRGLSGVRDADFPDEMGMFFWFSETDPRGFWMPDTWFDLDIVFLDEDLRVVYVAKNMKAHPGRETPPSIAKTPVILARYVLEVKANSAVSRELEEGVQLQWNAAWSLGEMESK